MKKLSAIVIVFVVALAGIALGQQPPRAEANKQLIPSCVKFGPVSTSAPSKRFSLRGYSINDTTQHEGKTYRCSAIYDQWMAKTSRVAWVQVTP